MVNGKFWLGNKWWNVKNGTGSGDARKREREGERECDGGRLMLRLIAVSKIQRITFIEKP